MSRQEQQQEMALDISISSEDQEDSNWIDCTEELALSSFSRFKDLRNAGHLSDVVIEAADGKQFPAHRVVLAATVPFFDLMFNSEMVEARSATVRLTNIDAETLETIIGFAYTGRIKAAFKNMERLLRAADYLQLRILSRHCADILKARLNERNVFSIRRFALAYNVPQAAIDADLWIQRNFMFISKTDDFAQLDFGTLRQILDWDQLYVDSEERVFEAVIHWLNYDLSSRGVFAPELLTLVRMPLLRPSFLIDEVSRHPLIWNDMMCRNIVDEAKNYHLVPERRSLFKTIFKTTIRVCVQMPGVIYALGGINHIQQETPSAVEVYDPKMKRWTVTKPMMSPRTRIGVAVSDGQIYVVGGYNGVERLRCVEVFDTATDTWKLLPSLHKRRSAMCAVALGEEIFVIGGYDGSNALDSVEAYEIKYKRWTMKRTMLSRRCAAGIAVVKGLIYVIGGHNGVQIFNSVECYDPVLDSWKTVAPMLNARCRLSATAYLDKIYVVGGYNDSNFLHTAEVYDPETDCWTHIAAMRMSRARVSLVTNGNLIYAIGGYDGENNISSMEIYNPATDHWEYGPSMVAHEGGVGAIAVPSPMQIKRTRNLKRPYGSRKQPPSDNGSPPAAAGTSSMRECGDEQLE